MTAPLVKKIAGILKQALPAAGITEAATLIKSVTGTRTAGSLAGGTNPTTTSIPGLGFVSTEKRVKVGGTLIESRDRVVCLLGDSLGGAVPTSNDKITIAGATMPVVDLEGNAALWTCLCRGT